MGIGINIAGTGIGLTQTIMNQKNKQTGQYDEVSGRVTHCLLLFAILLYAGFCRLFYKIAGVFVNFIQINRICLYCPIIKLLFGIYFFAVIRLLCL